MERFVDRDAGFAVFRQARSLCVRLHGTLHMEKARSIGRHVRADVDAVRLRLECSTLDAADPAAARDLAHAVLAWAQRRTDRSVDVLNLDLELQRGIPWHPLRSDTDEWVFLDPDPDAAWGLEARASRH